MLTRKAVNERHSVVSALVLAIASALNDDDPDECLCVECDNNGNREKTEPADQRQCVIGNTKGGVW